MIQKIKNHPTKENLKILTIAGYHYVVDKDIPFEVGEKVAICGPGTELGSAVDPSIEKYLVNGKVQPANIGGVISRGVVFKDYIQFNDGWVEVNEEDNYEE